MTTLVTIDRSALSLPALTMADMPPTSGFWVTKAGFGRPSKTKRRTYAANAPWVKGQLLTASAEDQSTQPLAFNAIAASSAALEALQDELEAALDQFTYTLTIAPTGRTWTCDPADITWGDITLSQSNAFLVSGAVTIPVYPVSS